MALNLKSLIQVSKTLLDELIKIYYIICIIISLISTFLTI